MSNGTVVKVLADLESVVNEVIAPNAIDVDVTGKFPRAALDALGKAGLLGLVSATEVGGLGMGHRAATLVVQRIARECASTAMIVAMHYAGAAVIEQQNHRTRILQAKQITPGHAQRAPPHAAVLYP